MSIAQKSRSGKSPSQLRQERAQTEFNSYSFRWLTDLAVTLKASGAVLSVPRVGVTNREGVEYTVLCAPGEAPLCNCPDSVRRGQGCKHGLMTERWLAGETPDPTAPTFHGKPLPADPFDVEEEGRYAAALADREALWEDHASYSGATR